MADIQLKDLKKFYGKGDRTVHAIDGINLLIGDREFVSIVGVSGSGKTTTLDCLGLLLRPTSGQVIIDGVDTGTLSDGKRAEFRSKKVGFIFQGFNLLPSLNALDNVLLPLRYSGGDKKAARKRAHALFEEIELADRMHHRPTELSGGEQQRVAIARALINQPALVLGDEPTGEVDSETTEKLISLMRRMNREYGVTFVIVTHDRDLASRTDRIVRLKDGKVIDDQLVALLPAAAPELAAAPVPLLAPAAAPVPAPPAPAAHPEPAPDGYPAPVPPPAVMPQAPSTTPPAPPAPTAPPAPPSTPSVALPFPPAPGPVLEPSSLPFPPEPAAEPPAPSTDPTTPYPTPPPAPSPDGDARESLSGRLAED